MKRVLCPQCRRRLEAGQRIHPECIDDFASAQQAKSERAAAKRVKAQEEVERADTKARKEAIKTIPQLIAEAQREFNAYIRERDRAQPCICCGRTATAVDGLGAHGWDAGHYRSTGSAAHLRFNENNVHRQLVHCNRYGAGRAVDYRIGLVARIGLDAVEALESNNQVKKWTREELVAIRNDYRARVREMKRAAA